MSDDADRVLWVAIRQAAIIIILAIETRFGLATCIVKRDDRRAEFAKRQREQATARIAGSADGKDSP